MEPETPPKVKEEPLSEAEKKAKLENVEPMEVVQRYTNGFHEVVEMLNTLKPSIEPTATGHMLEQIGYVQAIIKSGYAYESNGSVYFDVEKYSEKYNYGDVSGRKIEDLKNNTRDLKGQGEKKCPLDFVIWKEQILSILCSGILPGGKAFQVGIWNVL